MKRFVSLALALILVLAFALTVCSCGEKATCSTCNKEKYVKDMDVLYTDTWLDMEFFNDPAFADKKAEIMGKMMPYQINDELLEGSNAIVLHDMPMHVGFEISKSVEEKFMDCILDQAENRRHAEKAVMYTLLKK